MTPAPATSAARDQRRGHRSRRKPKEAPGAPIRIPARVDDQGRELDVVLGEMRSGIREQCGGELCLNLTVAYTSSNTDRCTFWETSPPQRSMVPRGSTVTVIAGSEACPTPADTPSEEGDGTTP